MQVLRRSEGGIIS